MLNSQTLKATMEESGKKIQTQVNTVFRLLKHKGDKMIDQDMRCMVNNIAVPHFYTEESLLKEEYETYKKTVDDFGFEQFSGIKILPKTIEVKEKRIEETRVDTEKLHEDALLPETIQLIEIKKKYPLNIQLILQSAKNLNIEGIVDEYSDVNVEDIEKIVQECNRLNGQKANANNPMHNKNKEVSEIVDQHSSSIFESLIKEGYIVVIDTCSLMHESMNEIMNHSIIPILEKYKSLVYITDPIDGEIKKKLRSKDTYLYHKAESARSILALLGKKGLYGVIENKCEDEDFVDAHLITLFTGQRRKHKMCLITNDNKHSNQGGLAGSITRLSDDPCINGILPIKVLSIHSYEDDAKLIEFSLNKDSNFSLHAHAPIRVKL